MSEKLNCQEQLVKLGNYAVSQAGYFMQGNSNKDPVELITEVASCKLEKNYLELGYDQIEERSARACVDEFASLEAKLHKLENERDEKSKASVESKSPKLFGKKKFETEMYELRQDIQKLQNNISILRTDIESKRADAEKAKLFLTKCHELKLTHDKQYAEDEEAFIHGKESTINLVYAMIGLSVPDSIWDEEWPKARSWLKEYFRREPSKRLFPVIGWSKAKQLAILVYDRRSNWLGDSDEVVIISGKAVRLMVILIDFLWSYVQNETEKDLIYFLIRANAFFFNMPVDANFRVLKFLDSGDVDDAHDITRIVRSLGEELLPYLREIDKSIKEGQRIALEENNENIFQLLSEFRRNVESRYGPLEDLMAAESEN